MFLFKMLSCCQVTNPQSDVNIDGVQEKTKWHKLIASKGTEDTSDKNHDNENCLNFNGNNVSLLSFGNEEQSIIKDCSSSKLCLKGQLFYNKELIIDQYGLRNGLRKKEDGKIFFGVSNAKDYKGNYYNDFIINCPKITSDGSFSTTGRVFEISYSKTSNEYEIRMIDGSLYLRYFIQHTVYFEYEKEYYMIIGIFCVTIEEKVQDKKIFVEIKVEEMEGENNQIKEYLFSEEEAPISIGRCNSLVNIDHFSVSKNHGIIGFRKETNQFYYKDLNSTNGSILILKQEDTLKLKGSMKFKLKNTLFQIMELP